LLLSLARTSLLALMYLGNRKGSGVHILTIGYTAKSLVDTASIVQDAGHGVMSAVGPRKALDLFDTAGADVVLLDRSVPELSKILLAKRMKQLKPEIPMIVVVAQDEERKAFPDGCIFAPEDRKGLLKSFTELQPKA
jgi:CheY-like chemotaxis protein